jgi:uncharacterized membrane protein
MRISEPGNRVRTKYIAFGVIGLMLAYVLVHNERFLIDPNNPVWEHYQTFKWWLLPHGLLGACALLLAPMQFSDRLRARFAKVHRVIGRIYVAGALGLAPLGAYISYLEEGIGQPRSFTIANIADAALLMITTGIGFFFALKRMIPQHRQWMTRSYACALIFFEARLILGVTGWDQPPNFEIIETVVWVCLAFAILIGDIANQIYELEGRTRTARVQASQAVAANAALS